MGRELNPAWKHGSELTVYFWLWHRAVICPSHPGGCPAIKQVQSLPWAALWDGLNGYQEKNYRSGLPLSPGKMILNILWPKKIKFKHIYYKHNFVLSWFLDAPFIILFITIALTVSSFLLHKFLICQNHWLPSWFLITVSEGKEVCSKP